MTAAHTTSRVGQLASGLFLKGLVAQGFETSNRHIVDYLPKDVAEAMFEGLVARCDRAVSFSAATAGERSVELAALDLGRVDLLPYLVTKGRSGANAGSEGFASWLRDNYAVDAERPRLLVVVTSQGNETQKSAQDNLADEALISLQHLLDKILDDRHVPRDSQLRSVSRAFHAYQPPEQAWTQVIERFEAWVGDVAELTPEAQGARLPELGCFLPDPTARFAAGGRVTVLEDRERSPRERGADRIHDNGLLYEYFAEAFVDPMVDPDHVLLDFFEDEDDRAAVSRAGVSGLSQLELGRLEGLGQRRRKRKKNEFERDTLDVCGAVYHRLLGHGGDALLVVAASGPFEVRLGLARGFDGRKEFAQVATWNAAKSKLSPKALNVVNGATEVVFPLEPRGDLSVARIALTKGPRSLRSAIDAVFVVVYRSAVPEIVVEEGREVSVEDQAWVVRGASAFHLYAAAGSVPVGVIGSAPLDPMAEGDDGPRRVTLEDTALKPVVVDVPDDEDADAGGDGTYAIEPLLELACMTHKRGNATTKALRSEERYLDAVFEVNEGAGRFKVDLKGGDMREVYASGAHGGDPFRYERAVAGLLADPSSWRLEWDGREFTNVAFPAAAQTTLDHFVWQRQQTLKALRGLALRKLPRYRRAGRGVSVPLVLLPLHPARAEIEALLAAWRDAVTVQLEAHGRYGNAHDVLLQTDTLRVLGEDGTLERLVVLPTHPWLLAALLQFQDRFSRNLQGAKEQGRGVNRWRFDLTRDDVEQLVPRTGVEDWHISLPATHCRLADCAPFHLEFVPRGLHVHDKPLEYVTRVVSTKIDRYLRMHPHLRDERRSLRIGFVNPGDGAHIFNGIERWFRQFMRQQSGRIRDLPMARIPTFDVFLFSDASNGGDQGNAFERFFRTQVSAADEDIIRQALLARIRYRFCPGGGPRSPRDSVHICFMHGLVDAEEKQQDKAGPMNEWWDGAFGDGMLSIYLRRTLVSDVGGKTIIQSHRGLWLDNRAVGLRGGLAHLLALQRACRHGDPDAAKALYWETELPSVAEMSDVYEHSDWVVHLDRELSLEIFRHGKASELPTIIEYSDQEVPQSPGYDVITATRNAQPYREQLGEILTLADLDVRGRGEEAQTAANAILDDINVLSGAWALDFLMGSIADERTSMRLKGNVGAALAYRWLRRMEAAAAGSAVVQTNVGEVVPVYVSLEDLLRATPATGLSQKEGLVHRYTNEYEYEDKEDKKAQQWCDDLLVLYLPKSRPGEPSRIYGRVIEVKFGKSAKGARDKAVGQVRNTQQLLRDRLAGDDATVDAPFRHKQLSLLIKAQLEQAVAMGIFTREIYEFLDVPVLSSNLATGNYSVDYSLGYEGQHLVGDAFLLHTGESKQQQQNVEVVEGVRIITVPRPLVEWLAFEPSDGPTLRSVPETTLPRLGKYTTVETQRGVEPENGGEPGAEAPAPAPKRLVELVDSEVVEEDAGEERDQPGLSEACMLAIKAAPYPDADVVAAVERLERALEGHKVRLASSPSPRETDRGPRLLRFYVRLEAGESINAVRRISEDIARVVGTSSSDIHISNVPERHAVGLDLPLPGLTYSVTFDELHGHPSFEAAERELGLGFCAGIDVTGRPVWSDLAKMPHMLVAGTTGSGKTVFLRNIILTLLLNNSPSDLLLRLSSSKPMDFRVFTKAPHAEGRAMARSAAEARALAEELVEEMEFRYALLEEALCDNLEEYNEEHPDEREPYLVAVFDEYAEMVASFGDKSDKDAFESAIGRLAQKARAAGIHLIVCMQRPDANVLKGAIKANILHRFALKLPQNHDSRVILDENGAETLLGQGDLLYKDASSKLFRLQVPYLDNKSLKRNLKRIIAGGGAPSALDLEAVKTCPRCGKSGPIGEIFGTRKMRRTNSDGTEVVVERPQSYCRSCR